MNDSLKNKYELTQREAEVAELIADGWSNQSIADKLVIQEKTVEHHINTLYSKLDDNGIFDGKSRRAVVALLFRDKVVD